ncbi:MAG: cupin domain-containing protein [Planctomycetota bacterium]|nr:cupin domain-containing protein [Planctomycetota bacterium]
METESKAGGTLPAITQSIVQSGLFDSDRLRRLVWRPLRPGIQAFAIYGQPGVGPAAALLKYEPGAVLPRHAHNGYEHVLVLTQMQCDQTGEHLAGTLVVNPPGTSHEVQAPNGCIALVIWEKPVRFITDDGIETSK